jgi:hypothetical protein
VILLKAFDKPMQDNLLIFHVFTDLHATEHAAALPSGPLLPIEGATAPTTHEEDSAVDVDEGAMAPAACEEDNAVNVDG